MKHGGFSKTVLFPWEDVGEFEALHDSLWDEWDPSGPLEEDAVFTILTCMWRKRRIRDRRNLETLASMREPDFEGINAQPVPLFDTKIENTMYVLVNRQPSDGKVRDRVTKLLDFSSSLFRSLDGQFVELGISMLGKEFSSHINKAVPKEKYPTTPEWVAAVKREVDEVLLPSARAEITSPVNLAAKAAAFITTDRIVEDLMLEERLDAMIDRAIRRLAQGKMMKQVAGVTAEQRERQPAPPLKISGPKPKRTKAKKLKQD